MTLGEELPLHEQLKKLNLEPSTSEQGQENEAKENPQQQPERGGGTKNIGTQPQEEEEENEKGEWLLNHPWQDKRPDPELQVNDTIGVSENYPPPKQWLDVLGGKTVDNLRRIYHYLPEFVSQMRGESEREMLKEYLKAETEKDKKRKMTPHMKEIIDEIEGKKPKDKPSYGVESYIAYSLKEADHQNMQEKIVCHLDCEYMLKMHLPENRQTWFKLENTPSRLIRISSDKKDKRWIFTPSFRRSEIALLDWPEDEIVTVESTIRILVVRPCEFGKYVGQCGHMFPIISLPNDEIGASYARFWIQKIALRLKLEFIWMIDDSVICFYEDHPDKKISKYKEFRGRQFGFVFEHIEEFFKPPGNNAAMSPRSTPVDWDTKFPFNCKPPFIAVYLNLEALKEKRCSIDRNLKHLKTWRLVMNAIRMGSTFAGTTAFESTTFLGKTLEPGVLLFDDHNSNLSKTVTIIAKGFKIS